MKSEEIDALETIFGDMSKDEISSVADGLREMDEQADTKSEPEIEENLNTIMAKLSASVPLPEAFKFKDKSGIPQDIGAGARRIALNARQFADPRDLEQWASCEARSNKFSMGVDRS